MYDAAKVAKAVEWHLEDDARTMRGKRQASPAEDRNLAAMINVIETATVRVTADNEVTGQLVSTGEAQAWSIVMKIAMEKAAAEAAPEAEIIQNTPVQWLLAW